MAASDHRRRPLPWGLGRSITDPTEPLIYRFYYQMTLIRRFEEQYLLPARWASSNKSEPTVGPEVCDVGVINALDGTRDFIFSTCRAHSHFIAYSDDISGFSSESLSLADSGNHDWHLRRFNMCSSGGEGNLIHKALEAALACKRRDTGGVSAVFLDRDTVNMGLMQEIGNLSSLWSLPVLFVLTDKGITQTTRRSMAQGEGDVVNRFQCPSNLIVADDVFKVYAFACAAVAYVRNRCSPFLLWLQTCDAGMQQEEAIRPTASNDDDGSSRDPLQKIARQLTPQGRELIEAFVQERIQEALHGAEPP